MLRDQIGFTQAIDSRGKGDTRRCDMSQNLLRCAGIFGHTCFSLRYILNNRCLISLSLAPVFRAVQAMYKARTAFLLPGPYTSLACCPYSQHSPCAGAGGG